MELYPSKLYTKTRNHLAVVFVNSGYSNQTLISNFNEQRMSVENIAKKEEEICALAVISEIKLGCNKFHERL